MYPRIDLVMPVYNEEAELPAVLASLACQVDSAGRQLARGTFRIIAVDNGSTDRSGATLREWAGSTGLAELIVLDEPRKGNVVARATGGAFSLADRERPVMVHADSDSRFPPTFIHDIGRSFAANRADVLSYLGFESYEFWKRVPRLARRQFTEVGSISFNPETLFWLGFDERQALFTPAIFNDFENVPTHCGLAMTKDIYAKAGGYIREFNSDGTERLGTARNLMFRLDRLGARLAHQIEPPVDVNPRRYLLEAEDLWAGRSYTAGMTDLREPIRDEHYAMLDALADRLDYHTARRNAFQRFIIDPCIARPGRIWRNRRYFGELAGPIYGQIQKFTDEREIRLYTDARPLSNELTDRYIEPLLRNLRGLRGIDPEDSTLCRRG
jgi:hypothetical protein